MVFLKDKIRKLVEDAVEKKFPGTVLMVKVQDPTEASHGDYAVATPLELAKKLAKNPRVIADELLAAIQAPEWISKIEIAGAGFLNFFVAPQFLTGYINEIRAAGEHFGESEIKKGKKVVTDTSHPNIAKPMGVHHLLSTIIGNSLNRIFAAVGYEVIRDNYIGDWGTQFGKLIYAYKTWGKENVVKANPIPELQKLYVKFHDEVERKPEIEDLGRAEFKRLESGDEQNRALWKWIVDLSMKEFQKIYERLGVTFDYIHGESFYEDKMQEIIDMGIKKGTFVDGEGGALIAPFNHKKYPPCIIRKSDGATLYATRDLARTKYWEDTWHPDLMVMVVDVAQTMHFQQFFEVSKMLGITDAENIHIVFGRMRFPEKRMSTRKGNIILLEDLLDEAEELAYKIVQEKNPNLEEEKKRTVARQVGVGAVKYAVLSQNRLTDVTFTWDKLLSLEGNSAPYLQYVYARARSILRKGAESMENAGADGTAAPKSSKNAYVLNKAQELAIARFLPKFPEVVVMAAEEFKPNLIANYLHDLASKFNSFYGVVPVLHAEPAAFAARLKLVEAVTFTLKNGLNLLGIAAPEEM